MDQFDFNSTVGRSSQMDILGFVSKFFVAAGHHRFHHCSTVLGRTSKCGIFVCLFFICSACLTHFVQFTCLSDHPCTNNFTSIVAATKSFSAASVIGVDAVVAADYTTETDPYIHLRCTLPQYISLAAAFAFLAVSVFLR